MTRLKFNKILEFYLVFSGLKKEDNFKSIISVTLVLTK